MDEPLTREELYIAINQVLETSSSDSVFHKRAYDSIVKLIENSEIGQPEGAQKTEKMFGKEKESKEQVVTGKEKKDA